MQSKEPKYKDTRSLRDFTRLVIAFFGTLVILALYQQIRLYVSGVLDQVVGRNLMLLIVHHVGFASLSALVLSFLFNGLEKKKAALGFKVTATILFLILVSEALLVDYYVTHFEILGHGFLDLYIYNTEMSDFLLKLFFLLSLCLGTFFLFYRVSSSTYKIIGRMYPFTIILFSLFLATLYSAKKPVNENKLQHLLYDTANNLLDVNRYSGEKEYPMLRPNDIKDDLTSYFDLREEAPNIVFIVLEGIGSDFVGENASYRGFMPYLDSLTGNSLYWTNHLSNTGESHASLPTILGSLPFGEAGFNKAQRRLNRNTLLGILKKNGYDTSFYYGGNSALHQWDKFLFEDRIDYMLDFKGFGDAYQRQKEDAAGISLGYPDKELYRKYFEEGRTPGGPTLEVFFTLSSKKPFRIPDREYYMEKVEQVTKANTYSRSASRIIKKNKEIFASLIYTDEALSGFMESYKQLPGFQNTIFVITGSHNLNELPPDNALTRYQVPLLIYSPLLKKKESFGQLVSHADIVPSFLGLLSAKYAMTLPDEVSFMGHGLALKSDAARPKQIPLYRHTYGIKDYVHGSYLISDRYLYQIGDEGELNEVDDDLKHALISEDFRKFRAINKYVTEEDKLMPSGYILFAQTAREPTKQEMIWINSVFSGSDYDNAYETARSLAFDGDRERALLLCSYILNQVPGHVDTEILMGRIRAWQGQYDLAAEILEGTVLKYPLYTDAYAALLDVYFWADKNEKAVMLQRQIIQHGIDNQEIDNKLDRAYKQQQKKQTEIQGGVEEMILSGQSTVDVNINE